MKQFVYLAALLFTQAGFAQVFPQAGPRSGGLGNTSLCLTDTWSVYNNPGAFGFADETSIAASYQNRFLLKELSSQGVAFGYHTEKSGNFGLHFQQYGFNLYREMRGGLTYAMKLSPNFAMGIGMNYHGIYLAENYGSRTAYSASIGLLYSLNDKIRLGMRVQNLNRAKLAEFEDERLPTYFALGMQYIFSQKIFWAIEAEKDLIHPVNIKSGLEIQAHEILALRLGVNSYPFQTSFGLGVKLSKFRFDIAAQWHTVLGISPSGGIKYVFN
jgi:hypothetical protein